MHIEHMHREEVAEVYSELANCQYPYFFASATPNLKVTHKANSSLRKRSRFRGKFDQEKALY